KVPASIMELYNSSISRATSGVDPEVILVILVNVRSLSPGLMRSGLYPTKKSLLYSNPASSSRMGTQTSSVAPGYTVDSYITISPFFRCFATSEVANRMGVRSGCLLSSTGVGTVMIKISHDARSSDVLDTKRPVLPGSSLKTDCNKSSSTSRVESCPFLISVHRPVLISNPTTGWDLENSTARGNPT